MNEYLEELNRQKQAAMKANEIIHCPLCGNRLTKIQGGKLGHVDPDERKHCRMVFNSIGEVEQYRANIKKNEKRFTPPKTNQLLKEGQKLEERQPIVKEEPTVVESPVVETSKYPTVDLETEIEIDTISLEDYKKIENKEKEEFISGLDEIKGNVDAHAFDPVDEEPQRIVKKLDKKAFRKIRSTRETTFVANAYEEDEINESPKEDAFSEEPVESLKSEDDFEERKEEIVSDPMEMSEEVLEEEQVEEIEEDDFQNEEPMEDVEINVEKIEPINEEETEELECQEVYIEEEEEADDYKTQVLSLVEDDFEQIVEKDGCFTFGTNLVTVPINKAKIEFLIGGTRECDLFIKNSRISHKHAVIKYMYGKYFIKDISTNGIKYIYDDIEISLPKDSYVELKEGTKLSFAGIETYFRYK